MIKMFMLLIEYPTGEVELAKARDEKHIVSTEENIYLLNELGDSLLEKGSIAGYQILGTEGSPVRKVQ